MTFSRSSLLIIAASLSLGACSSIGLNKDSSADNGATAGANASAIETPEQRSARLAKALAGQSVYFDFDSYTVKPDYQGAVSNDAQLLKSAPDFKARVEGNTDERGTTEYNLALGQKRAEAVKRALTLLGVPAEQIEAVSFGKEKPRAACHDDSCWSQNRRADIAPAKQ